MDLSYSLRNCVYRETGCSCQNSEMSVETKFPTNKLWPLTCANFRDDTLFFFIRTKFIRTLSLNFGEILRTFLTLKLTRFLIVLKLKYWGSKSCFKQKMHFFVNLSVLFSPKMWQYMLKFSIFYNIEVKYWGSKYPFLTNNAFFW